ncbi:MAG: hypothetical protein ACKOGH_01430, partial [Alphaproteobacteria bacterium]
MLLEDRRVPLRRGLVPVDEAGVGPGEILAADATTGQCGNHEFRHQHPELERRFLRRGQAAPLRDRLRGAGGADGEGCKGSGGAGQAIRLHASLITTAFPARQGRRPETEDDAMRNERANGDGSPVVEAMDAAGIAAKAGELAGLLVDCAARGNAFGCPTGLREEAAREYWDRVSREVAAGRALALRASRDGGILGTLVLRWRAVGGGAPAGRIDLDAPIVATDGARHEVVPALLARVDAEASLRMASLVAIEVQASSPDAAQLRRRGFRLSGRIPHGAGPGQDALLFWKDPSAGAPAHQEVATYDAARPSREQAVPDLEAIDGEVAAEQAVMRYEFDAVSRR